MSKRVGDRKTNADEPVHGQDQTEARTRETPGDPQQKNERRRS